MKLTNQQVIDICVSNNLVYPADKESMDYAGN